MPPLSRADLRARIKTVVVCMMENRSFDNMLGWLGDPRFGTPSADGLDPARFDAYANPCAGASTPYQPFPMFDTPLDSDLPHEKADVLKQLACGADGRPTMKGFVQAYLDKVGNVPPSPPPMGYYRPDALPMTSFLAREYTVCDRFFSSLPSATQPNRLMALSGYSEIDDSFAGLLPDQDLVTDWLDAHQVRWRVYHRGFLSFFALFHKMWPELLGPRFQPFARLVYDVKSEPDATFPQVIFVEPCYGDAPLHVSDTPNDNHPPLPVGPGEAFLRNVYNVLTSNPERWASTLLVVTYDEHGGFFDHVVPPATPGEMFPTAGVRVPTLLVSPYAAKGGLSSLVFDHTSVLQLVADLFAPGDEAFNYHVARRRQWFLSLSEALEGDRRMEIPPAPADPIVATSIHVPMPQAETAGQHAFLVAAQGFAEAHREDAFERYPDLASIALRT